jgi:uncharacterized RDD family membrane protein YckC
LQKPTAVAAQRLAAFTIDTLLICAIIVVFWFLLVDKLPKDQVVGDAGFDIGDKRYAFTEENSGKQTIWFLLAGATAFVMSVVVPSFAGWSPGRAVAGIRVVDYQGRPPGFVKSLVRWLVWIVDSFFFWAVGGILVLATAKNQRLGDMATNTYTVKKELAGQPLQFDQPAFAQSAYAQQAPGAGWHPDPRGEARLRYWDGSQWTDHTSA